MKSAIEIVAFSQGSDLIGILNLLEVTREALDRNGYTLAATHLDMATSAIRANQRQRLGDPQQLPTALTGLQPN